MKKVLLRYCLFTLLIVIITGVYIWYVNHDNLASLSYIQDTEWSKWHSITPKVDITGCYESGLDTSGHLHLSWMEYNREKAIGEVYHTIVNDNGKVIQKPKILLEDPRLFDIVMLIRDDLIHCFWVGTGNRRNLSLFYSVYDCDGQLQTEKTVLTGEIEEFQNMNNLKVAATADQFMLVWVSGLDSMQIKGVLVSTDGTAMSDVLKISDGSAPVSKPEIVVDNMQQYHVAWLQQNYSEDNEDGSYNLMYRSVDAEGQALFAPRLLDRAASNPLAMAVGAERVYLVWTKAKPLSFKEVNSLDGLLPKYNLYGTSIQYTNPATPVKVNRLTEEIGPSFHQSMAVDSKGAVHLVYYDFYKDELILTHEVYADDLQRTIKQPKRIYPNFPIFYGTGQIKLKYGTILISDANNGIHLVWLNTRSKDGSRFYYANSLKPAKISPLQVIGLDQHHIITSTAIGLLYVLGIPITNVFVFTLFFIFVIVALLVLLLWLIRKWKWRKLIDNPYVLSIIISVLHTWIIYKVDMKKPFFWPTQPDLNQMWFVYGVGAVMGLVFLFVNRRCRFKNITLAGLTSFFWVYWINMITLMFYIPNVIGS